MAYGPMYLKNFTHWVPFNYKLHTIFSPHKSKWFQNDFKYLSMASQIIAKVLKSKS